jgi:hypothetical protein
MKNYKKGSVIPLLITAVALVAIGVGIYFYINKIGIKKYDSEKIMCELENLSHKTSFAYDMVLPSTKQTVKRMFFQEPGIRMRTEWIRDGQNYVFISREEGNYEYFPDKKIAYFTPGIKKSDTQEKKCIPEDLEKFTIIGEDKIENKDCYVANFLLDNNGSKTKASTCIWKDTGQNLYLKADDKTIWYYDNYEFNISDELFNIPRDVKIINK